VTSEPETISTRQHPGQRQWRSVLPPGQADRARDTAVRVAERLRALTTTHAPTTLWRPISVAEGDVGAALVCGYVGDCTEDESWSTVAHRFLESGAKDAQQSAPAPPGLLDGLAGLGFAASRLSRGGVRYQRLVSSVDHALSSYLETVARQKEPDGTVRDFDVVSGLTGIGVYFLQRAAERTGMAALISVAELLTSEAGGPGTPYLWSTPGDALVGPIRDDFPDGCLDCGVAHGVPGPLALLARARIHGVRTAGLDAAIEKAAGWLVARRIDDDWGPNWPIGVPLNTDCGPNDRGDRRPPARAAWCYGGPGVARALWAAGVALDRADWCALSTEAMRAVYRRPPEVRLIRSPGLCHGYAGLLQITSRFYHDTQDEFFAAQASAVTDELLNEFDSDTPFGYRNTERGSDFDNPGFLEGAAGVAAALLAAATDITPAWDQVLLIG
jgi:hypothetical protein